MSLAFATGLHADDGVVERTRYLDTLRAKPVPADLDELAITAQLYAHVGAPREEQVAMARIAERAALDRVMGRPSDWPPTLKAAVTREVKAGDASLTQLSNLRFHILREALQVAPTRAEDRGTVTLSFRNASSLPLLEARGIVLRPHVTAFECRTEPGMAALPPGETARLRCVEALDDEAGRRVGDVMRNVDWRQGGFFASSIRYNAAGVEVTQRGTHFAMPRGEAQRRYDAAMTRAKPADVERVAAPAPVPRTAGGQDGARDDYLEHAMRWQAYVTLGMLAAGWILGLGIGIRADNPRQAARALCAVTAVLLLLGILIFAPAILGGAGNSGSLEGQIGLLLGGAMIIGGSVIAAWLWAWFTAGLIIGSLLGAGFLRRARPRQPQ